MTTCPVDSASTRKKKLFLSTWYLENPTYGGLGDPSGAAADFGKKVHEMTVEGIIQVIDEFHEIHSKMKGRKLNRKDTRF